MTCLRFPNSIPRFNPATSAWGIEGCSYAHWALLKLKGVCGVFRIHQKIKVEFPTPGDPASDGSYSVIQPAVESPLGTEPRCSITRLRLPESLPSQYRMKPTACGNLARTIHTAYSLASGRDQPRWTA